MSGDTEESALERILWGIRASEVTVRHEDLERERERVRLRHQRVVLAVMLSAALSAAGLTAHLWVEASSPW